MLVSLAFSAICCDLLFLHRQLRKQGGGRYRTGGSPRSHKTSWKRPVPSSQALPPNIPFIITLFTFCLRVWKPPVCWNPPLYHRGGHESLGPRASVREEPQDPRAPTICTCSRFARPGGYGQVARPLGIRVCEPRAVRGWALNGQ